MLKALIAFLLASLLAAGPAIASQIPPEWQAAAQTVIGELERDTPYAARPWGNELTDGWNLARLWRRYNNRNSEIILAEYLTFVAVCRQGCVGHTIEGQDYRTVAEQMKALRSEHGGPYVLAANAHAWLANLPDPTGAARRNADLWGKDLDAAAADFATGNLYALAWLLARAQPTQAEQANTFARFALFVQGRGWIGTRCLDISRVAMVLDTPPRIEVCR
jgi:hypothetical protein